MIMNVSEAIAKRESVRAYLNTQVSSEDLAKIVEAGQWAPNAGPFQITVVRKADVLKKVNDRTYDAMIHSDREFLQQRAALPGYQPLYGAPVLIVLSGPPNVPFSAVNTALAAENMILQATELGLGSCYVISPTLALTGDKNSNLAKEAGIPDGYTMQCGVLVGYAAAENKFSLGERTRKGSVNYVD